ncbi:MAG TPA: sugar phosphate isomerase/epimerase family protein [Chloroflexota bacterium]|nr:sugar phosphate isomerase/epimerase family protein [Chloroflexota bacterium]
MKFGTCNEMFEGWDIPRQFESIARTGYQGVEIAPFTIASNVTTVPAAQRREVASVAKANGLEVIGLHWLLVGPEGMYITDPDPVVRERTVEYLKELMRFCADVDGQVLVFGSPKQRNLKEGVTREQARAWLIDAFQQVLPIAADAGVTLCLEPLPPPECNFIQTTSEAIDVIEAINHPNLRLILDVKSMSGEQQLTGSPIPDTIRRVAPYVAHVQANDANLGYPGSGEIDFVPIFRALRDVGYDGFVSVEVFDFSPGPEKIAIKSIEYMRRCLADAEKTKDK